MRLKTDDTLDNLNKIYSCLREQLIMQRVFTWQGMYNPVRCKTADTLGNPNRFIQAFRGVDEIACLSRLLCMFCVPSRILNTIP